MTGAFPNVPRNRPFLMNGPRYSLGLLQRSLTVQRFRPEPPGRNVIPIEVLAGPSICEAHLKAPTVRDGLVFDDADAVCHPDILAPCARTNTETAVPLSCCSEQLGASRNGLILLASVRST